jgi:putative ABC transport system permease protein
VSSAETSGQEPVCVTITSQPSAEADAQVETTSTDTAYLARQTGSTGGRLLRFALANIVRRPERFVLSMLGIALAIMAVTVVRTISAGFANTGTASLNIVLDGSPIWVVPAQGVQYDANLHAFLADGAAPAITAPAGWSAVKTSTVTWHSAAGDFAVYGRSGTGDSNVKLSSDTAAKLGVTDGETLDLSGKSLSVSVSVSGTGSVLIVSPDVAATLGAANGWWTVIPPAADAARNDLGSLLSKTTGLPSTTDPSMTPVPSGSGLIYDTTSSKGAVTFQQSFGALFSGKVTSSALGLVSIVGLILGFVIAVSSFLASVQERRREFGIMSSIGLADEVLYFFLVESALVFAAAYLVGVVLAGISVAIVVPSVAGLGSWLQAAGTVAAYLPAMAIVGALVPVHRLLQERPVALLTAQS